MGEYGKGWEGVKKKKEGHTYILIIKIKTLVYVFIVCVCLDHISCGCSYVWRSEDSLLELVFSFVLWILETAFNASGLVLRTFTHTHPAILSLKHQLSLLSNMEKTFWECNLDWILNLDPLRS